MNNHRYLIILLASMFLVACSGSTTYRGTWKAVDNEGKKLEIFFDAKLLKLTDSSHQIKEYNYTQNSVNITNGVETYGIQIQDVGSYQLYFPFTDESKGFITDPNGNVMYTISRDEYITQEEASLLM